MACPWWPAYGSEFPTRACRFSAQFSCYALPTSPHTPDCSRISSNGSPNPCSGLPDAPRRLRAGAMSGSACTRPASRSHRTILTVPSKGVRTSLGRTDRTGGARHLGALRQRGISGWWSAALARGGGGDRREQSAASEHATKSRRRRRNKPKQATCRFLPTFRWGRRRTPSSGHSHRRGSHLLSGLSVEVGVQEVVGECTPI